LTVSFPSFFSVCFLLRKKNVRQILTSTFLLYVPNVSFPSSSSSPPIQPSRVHGWEPGRMHVFRARGKAPKVEGVAWDALEGVNPTMHPRSFFSQPTAVLTLHDAEHGNAPYLMYVGDNWVFGLPHDASQVGG
jgi:hypothetical protein